MAILMQMTVRRQTYSSGSTVATTARFICAKAINVRALRFLVRGVAAINNLVDM